MVTSEWPTQEHPEWVPFLVDQVEQLRCAGIRLDVFSFRGAMRPHRYLLAWVKLQRRLKAGEWDLLHAQFGQAGLLALWPKPYPLVVTFHGSDLNGFTNSNGRLTVMGALLRRISQAVSLHAEECILVSEQLAVALPEKRYHVIPCGIDLERFKPSDQKDARRELGLALDRQYVLFTGAPENPIKRYNLARSAADLVGEPAELLTIRDVPHDQMPQVINAADVLLLTSTREGSPTVVKEALACNLPVVSVDVGDVRKRLEGVEGCVVCEDDRPETIAAAIRRTLDRQTPIDGRPAVMDLDGARLAQHIIQVYQKAIHDHQA